MMQASSNAAFFVSSISTAKSYRQNQLREMMEIGRWECGSIYRAKLLLQGHRSKIVTVKTATETDDAYSEKERLSVLQHHNIVKFVGLAHTSKSAPWLIMEYLDNGNLKEYVESYEPDWNGLTKMAHGIASAMKYLHTVAKVVHGDLAARNILVGANNHVKLTDCGIHNTSYPKVYQHDIAGQACPIRWMPPENYPEPKVAGKFNKKGDIWAFGIVCCELWMHGVRPYGTMNHHDVMHYIRAGTSPLEFMDVDASEFMIHIMHQCFKPLKYQRPTFSHIIAIIRQNVAPSIVC